MSTTGGEGSSDDEGPAVNSEENRSAIGGPRSSSLHVSSSPEAHGGRDGYEDEDEDEEAEEERETRFTGPPSTWRSYTENERVLAASLTQTHANDLSLHLYNTHALKARLQHGYYAPLQTAAGPAEPQDFSQTGDEGKLWQPDATWTAWPLKPEDVPRLGENFGSSIGLAHDDHTYCMTVSWRPREDLEDEIKALMLRQMKLNSRQHQNLRSKGALGSPSKNKAPVPTADSSSPHRRDRPGVSADIKMGEMTDPSRKVNAIDNIKNEYILDDDDAEDLLRPVASHVLEKFDLLLDGLHRSRKVRRGKASRKRTRPTESQNESESMGISTRSPSRRPKHENQIGTTDTDSSDSDNSAAETRSSKRPRRRKKLRPRDWREVMKIASLVGWDEEILRRTAVRCAALFGNEVDPGSMDLLTSHFETPMTVGVDAPASAPRTAGAPASKPALTYCPFQECARHAIPYEKPWRWREHMKRTHKYTKQQIQELEIHLQNDNQTESEALSSQLSATPDRNSTSSESSSE